ncbi:MAG: hypothetical protein A2066_21695 [Bacteroidetes bacterium GWB2_41_8]|nr:MAG: hypothetical protein A2066_21695 [Bacteroidetes bacterium GWB2_41_8]
MKMNEIIERIKELIPQAPPDWADTIAAKMGKSSGAVYAYARGDRGIRKGYHKEVLAQLKELVAEENERTKELLS